MNAELDLEMVKNFLRVDHDEDDMFIQLMIRASKSFVETFLNQPLSNFGETYPEEIDIARLQLMSQWYDVRTIMSPRSNVKELAFVFTDLLEPHRNWQVGAVGGSLLSNGIDSLDSIFYNRKTGLFYRAEIVDTHTALYGNESEPKSTLFTDSIDNGYNQSFKGGVE